MTRGIPRLAIGFAGILLMVMVTAAAYAESQWNRTFEAPYPAIRASSDPAVIAKGRYLAYGPAHCAACHASPADQGALEIGDEVPLKGGVEWKLPLGVVRSPNITSDPVSGIGRYSDAEIARTLRHGVRPDGRSTVPFMEFQNLADDDLVAIISFLRSSEPVRGAVPATELNFVGRAMMATMIRPVGPALRPAELAPPEGPSIERGAYLVNTVGGCAGCHTKRSVADGAYLGPRLAGGSPMPLQTDLGTALVPPNLTPDPETGHIYDWSAEQFVARFRAGRIQEGSHMPWPQFARMSDNDLSAIYRYLKSIQPIQNDPGAMIQKVNAK